jgi:hypothetical protein
MGIATVHYRTFGGWRIDYIHADSPLISFWLTGNAGGGTIRSQGLVASPLGLGFASGFLIIYANLHITFFTLLEF